MSFSGPPNPTCSRLSFHTRWAPEGGGAAAAAEAQGKPKKKTWFSTTALFSSASSAAAAAPEWWADYPSSRYVCPIKGIAQALVDEKLSATDFPPVPGQAEGAPKAAAQSVRRAPGWGSTKKAGFAGGRSIIFVAGGVTHAEMQFASQVSAASNKEVILGGTSILNPEAFLASLKAL